MGQDRLKPRGVLLPEADVTLRRLERLAASGDRDAAFRLFRELQRAGRPLPPGPMLRAWRIRTGEARQFDRVVARVGHESYPRGVHDGKWVHVGRWEPRVEDERKSDDYGLDPDQRGDRYDAPWIVGLGSGFLTYYFLVYAHSGPDDAVTACEEEWPEEFADWHPDYEGEPGDGGPDIRVIARCDDWQAARKNKHGLGEELLDGTVIDSV